MHANPPLFQKQRNLLTERKIKEEPFRTILLRFSSHMILAKVKGNKILGFFLK